MSQIPETLGGVALIFAILNGWLASQRKRSGWRWAIASALMAPAAWVLTVYLVLQAPTGGPEIGRVAPAWPWIKLGALAVAVAILMAAFVNALGGFPPGGATSL